MRRRFQRGDEAKKQLHRHFQKDKQHGGSPLAEALANLWVTFTDISCRIQQLTCYVIFGADDQVTMQTKGVNHVNIFNLPPIAVKPDG